MKSAKIPSYEQHINNMNKYKEKEKYDHIEIFTKEHLYYYGFALEKIPCGYGIQI